VSATSGILHDEVEQLCIKDIHEFHTHVSRIFEEYHVQVIKKGMARITISLLETK
jgi:hypothetical protein